MSSVALARKGLISPIFRSPHLRLFSTSAPQNQDPKSLQCFAVNDYLVTTFGFSPAKAATISKPIAHLKSPHNPDAVRSFLHNQGFHISQIKTIVTGRPNILCSSLENTILPNLRALRDTGLSTSALNQIILSNPQALQLSSALPRIMFWKDFAAGQEPLLLKLFKRNRGLVNHDINTGITTKISLLQSHGMSKRDIQWISCTAPQFITTSVSLMEDLLNRAKELGFQPGTKMFVHALQAMTSVTKEAMQKKMELFKNFGWSEEEFLSAVRKAPSVVTLSEKNLQGKMNFLLHEAGLDLSYVSFNSWLLGYCLEKRLRPRYHVLRLVESKILSEKRKSFYNAIKVSNSEFMAKHILPHTREFPELHAAYLTACTSGSGLADIELKSSNELLRDTEMEEASNIFEKEVARKRPIVSLKAPEE